MASLYVRQGKQLRDWREKAYLTAAEVVEGLEKRGVHLPEYSVLNMEAGKSRMWASTFKDYMIVLGIPDQQAPDYFSFSNNKTATTHDTTRRKGVDAGLHKAAREQEKEAIRAANLAFAEETGGPSAKYRESTEAHLSEYLLATEAARKKREAAKVRAKQECEAACNATSPNASGHVATAKKWRDMSDAEMLAELLSAAPTKATTDDESTEDLL